MHQQSLPSHLISHKSRRSTSTNTNLYAILFCLILSVFIFLITVLASHNTLFGHELSSSISFQRGFVENKYNSISTALTKAPVLILPKVVSMTNTMK